MKIIYDRFFRYALVGLASNAILYLLYLVLTWVGMGHKTAMTLLYVVGILQTYVFNRNWTFRHDGRVTTSFVRYVVTYALGYFVTLTGLMLFVDGFGMPHQLVMGVLVLVVAVLIFAMQKYWIFPEPTTSDPLPLANRTEQT